MSPPKISLLSATAVTALLLVPRLVQATASEWSVQPQSSVRLISPWRTAPRSGELILGLQFRLAPGWHVYWKNSGDAGYPPAVTFQPAEVLGKPELLWPTPHRFDLPGGLVAFGYEDEVIYPVRATIKPDALPPAKGRSPTQGRSAEETPQEDPSAGESLPITADLDYVVCEVACIPYRAALSLEQSLEQPLEQPLGEQPEPDPDLAPLLQAWLDRLPRTAAEVQGIRIGASLDASRPGQPELEVRLLGVEAQPGQTDLFLETHELVDAGRPRIKTFSEGVIFRVPLKPKEVGKPFPEKVLLAWTVSNLSHDGTSFGLEARREVDVRTGAAGKPEAPGANPAAAPQRLFRLLLRAFAGGLLLNLAPTVLALLAGEALALRQAGPGAREGAAAAATGIAGGCWAVAALAVFTRNAGQAAGSSGGWGTQAQEPAVSALLAVAAALLALNLWGLVEVPLARAGSSRSGTGRHLLAGLFTVPLALAWPVPMLQEPLDYAFGRGPATVCAVFAVLGLGLALPYLLIALAPAAIRRMPEAATGLPRLREGLGFLAAAGIFWILRALSRQVSPEGLAWIELSLLGMALLAWLRVREGSGKTLRLLLTLGLAACAAGALWLADRNRLVPRPSAAARQAAPATKPIPGLPPVAREPIFNQTSGG